MRKSLFILSLVGMTLLTSATDVFAQRVRATGRGGPSVIIGGGGRGYYDSPYYRQDSYGQRGYQGWYGQPRSYQPYYRSYDGYYYPDTLTQVPATEYRQSFYPEIASQQSSTVMVMVPTPDAKVWFDDSPTAQQGMQRTFNTPPLDPGTYTYTIRARWTENGQKVERQRQVRVQPGQSATVDFRFDKAERLPRPQ